MREVKMIQVEVMKKEDEKKYDKFCTENNTAVQLSLQWKYTLNDCFNLESYYLLAKENDAIVGVLPFFIKENSHGNIANSLFCHSYGGVHIKIGIQNKEDIYKSLIDKMIQICKCKNCVAITMVTQPFLNDLEIYKKILQPDHIHDHFLQYIDIADFKYHRNMTRNIKKSLANNVKVIESDSKELFETWYEIHIKRMGELKGMPIKKEIFIGALKYLVPKDKAKFFYAFKENTMIAGCLYIYNKTLLDVFMLSADSDYMNITPNALLTDITINWAKQKGLRYYNWQSSKAKGVYTFKERCGSKTTNHYYLTKIIGDVSRIKEMKLDKIKEEYKFFFVLPYSVLTKNENKK